MDGRCSRLLQDAQALSRSWLGSAGLDGGAAAREDGPRRGGCRLAVRKSTISGSASADEDAQAMGIRVEVREGESFIQALRRFRRRVDLARRVKPGKLRKGHHEKPSRAARQKEWARKSNAWMCSMLGEAYSHGFPLSVAGGWWLEGRYH